MKYFLTPGSLAGLKLSINVASSLAIGSLTLGFVSNKAGLPESYGIFVLSIKRLIETSRLYSVLPPIYCRTGPVALPITGIVANTSPGYVSLTFIDSDKTFETILVEREPARELEHDLHGGDWLNESRSKVQCSKHRATIEDNSVEFFFVSDSSRDERVRFISQQGELNC